MSSPPSAESDAWLLSRDLFGIRPGVERMQKILELLDSPQLQFDAIHVVGSNGKSSTVRFIEGLLGARGVKSGAYVSPHFVHFSERVIVDGQPLSPERFAAAIQKVRAVTELWESQNPDAGPVTQFEAGTAAAFVALADAGVECAAIEAGLGGRWDATNVLAERTLAGEPAVAVLTNVSLEHTKWLGNTVAEIAAEKAEVLKPGGKLVIGHDLAPEARQVVSQLALARGAIVIESPGVLDAAVPTPGAVSYQRTNLALAQTAVAAYLGGDDLQAVTRVAESVVVPGRFEITGTAPTVIEDGAHNAAGARALAQALQSRVVKAPLALVVAVLDDKSPREFIEQLAPWVGRVFATQVANPRALPAGELAQVAAEILGAEVVQVVTDPREALRHAREESGPTGTVLVSGSLHLIAELRRPPGVAGPQH